MCCFLHQFGCVFIADCASSEFCGPYFSKTPRHLNKHGCTPRPGSSAIVDPAQSLRYRPARAAPPRCVGRRGGAADGRLAGGGGSTWLLRPCGRGRGWRSPSPPTSPRRCPGGRRCRSCGGSMAVDVIGAAGATCGFHNGSSRYSGNKPAEGVGQAGTSGMPRCWSAGHGS